MFMCGCSHCSVFSLSQVTMTRIMTTPPVTVVCSLSVLITLTVMLALTSGGQITLGQQDLVLPPQLTLRDTMRGFAGLTDMPQPQ